MAKVVIFGVEKIAELICHYLQTDSEHEVVAFTVDKAYIKTKEYCGLPVVPFETVERQYSSQKYSMIIAISYVQMNELRKAKFLEAKEKGYHLISYISSKCIINSDKDLGENVIILEGNTIQPYVSIGDNTIIWAGNVIGHHVKIGDHCFIAGNVAIGGMTKIGEGVFMGPGSTIVHGLEIGQKTAVLAGCTILKNTNKEEVYRAGKALKLSFTSNEMKLI